LKGFANRVMRKIFGPKRDATLRRLLVTVNVVPSSPILVVPDDGGAKLLQNVVSYESHPA
jgi:hypothetical protein